MSLEARVFLPRTTWHTQRHVAIATHERINRRKEHVQPSVKAPGEYIPAFNTYAHKIHACIDVYTQCHTHALTQGTHDPQDQTHTFSWSFTHALAHSYTLHGIDTHTCLRMYSLTHPISRPHTSCSCTDTHRNNGIESSICNNQKPNKKTHTKDRHTSEQNPSK
jgi:hypothetical protein